MHKRHLRSIGIFAIVVLFSLMLVSCDNTIETTTIEQPPENATVDGQEEEQDNGVAKNQQAAEQQISKKEGQQKDMPVWVIINDIRRYTENQPYVEGINVYLPLEELCKYLGATAKRESEQIVTIKYKNQQIQLNIDNGNVLIGEKEKQLDCKPQIVDDCLYVTQHFFSDILNLEVSWDKNIRVVQIVSILRIPIEPC